MTNLEVIQRGKDDLLFFGRAIVPQMFTVASAPFHREMSDLLLNEELRLLNMQAPRGHAKTSYAANLKPLHILAYESLPSFIVLVSKTEGHSARNLQTIKDTLEYSEHFRQLYGYWGRHTAKVWTNTWVELTDPRFPKRTIAIMARGANQQMRGLKHINQRPTYVVYDDPEDETNTITPEARDKTFSGLANGIVPGLAPGRGRACVIGTPIMESSLVRVLEDMPTWHSVRWQALNPIDGVPDDAPEERRYWALWPEVWSVPKLLAERESASAIGKVSSFYSEYQCEIVGDADQLFRKEYFRYWTGTVERDANGDAYLAVTAISSEGGEMVEKEEKIPVNLFMGVDPASSTRRTADYSVIFVLALTQDKRVFCVDYFRKRVKPFTLADNIVAFYKKYRPQRTQIESTGYQEMLRQYLREHVNVHIPGMEIRNTPRTAKSERLEGLQPDFALGKVYLRPTMTTFEDELLMFPRGKHDDVLDGFYYARKGAYIPYHEVQDKADVKRAETIHYDWQVE